MIPLFDIAKTVQDNFTSYSKYSLPSWKGTETAETSVRLGTITQGSRNFNKMSSRNINIISIPSDIGSVYAGKSRAPDAFKTAGLHTQLSAAGFTVTESIALSDGPANWTSSSCEPNGARNEEATVKACHQVRNAVQKALKNHNIPMTSIAARAQDLIESESQGEIKPRDDLITTMMRYLDTDTLLCWAPEHQSSALEMQTQRPESLREIQIRTATPIISYLSTSVWPGIEIKPVLDENSIMPTKQDETTTSVIKGWMAGLPAYELAALERATLAAKSVLVATRLLIEWSEEFRDMHRDNVEKRFGIEEAAEASSLEVRWQTGMWGEVEDTHDVDNEDIRRQLGSAILLVSGNR